MPETQTEQAVVCRNCGASQTGRFCSECGNELTNGNSNSLRSLLDTLLRLGALRRYASRFVRIAKSPAIQTVALAGELTQAQGLEFLTVGLALYSLIMLTGLASISGPLPSFILPPLYFTVVVSIQFTLLYYLGSRKSTRARSPEEYLPLVFVWHGFNLPIMAVIQKSFLLFSSPSRDSLVGLDALVPFAYVTLFVTGIEVSVAPYGVKAWSAFWGLSRRKVFSYLLVSGAASAFAGVGLLFAFGVFPPKSAKPLGTGDCVRILPNKALKGTSCTSSAATSIILSVDKNTASIFHSLDGSVDCPEDTDSFELLNSLQTACLRNLHPPHPGDVGEGGGILRKGDCINTAKEIACRTPGIYATVTERVAATSECPPATLEFVKLTSAVRPIACLDNGPGVISPGDCVHSPSLPFGGSKVACPPALTKPSDEYDRVVSRVPTGGVCPAGTSPSDLNSALSARFSGLGPMTLVPVYCIQPL
ncbi:MAG: hypothetical protein QOE57_1847 [Acidimicrobiaceae bacterium]|nr:hypothetical protein [Acidimicrobiaceae bacterium]